MANELQNKLNAILEDKNTNLLPENLKAGVTCLGIEGTMETGIDTSDADATINDIVYGKTAYVNGEKITGWVTEWTSDMETNLVTDGEVAEANDGYDIKTTYTWIGEDVLIRENQVSNVFISQSSIASAIGLTADKIKSGETVLGITGTYTGEASEE